VKLDHGTWVVVADGEKYLLLHNKGDRDFLHLEVIDQENSPNAPARELSTDRPGRQHDAKRDLGGSGNVAAWGTSAMEETDWHRVEEARFAKHVAEKLGQLAAAGRFDRLVVIADPRSLGEFRSACDASLKARIVAEIDKDLTNLPLDKMEASITAYGAD